MDAHARGGLPKRVSMATASTYLTERRYVTRQPLFAAARRMPILRKTRAEEEESSSREEEERAGMSPEGCQDHADGDVIPGPREEVTSGTLSFLQPDTSPRPGDALWRRSQPWSSGEDLGSPLGVSDLRGAGPSLDEAAFGSSFLDGGSDPGSLTGTSPEATSPVSPASPRLSSTLRTPRRAPRPPPSEPLCAGSRREGREERRRGERVETYLKTSSSTSYLTRDSMSLYQANYWMCAIPKSLPPSPDRRSPSWDPDGEYQTLLDYTYPLRPGKGTRERGGCPRKQAVASLPRTQDRCLHDSGIGLDGFCSATSLPGVDDSPSGGAGRSRGRGCYDLPGLPGSWDSPDLPSPADPVGSSPESLDSGQGRAGGTAGRRYGERRAASSLAAPPASSFARPTGGPPRRWDVDEEFRRLPDQLEELKTLSSQVRGVTAMLNQPLGAGPLSGRRQGQGAGPTSRRPSAIGPSRKAQSGEEVDEEEEAEAEEEAEEEEEAGRGTAFDRGGRRAWPGLAEGAEPGAAGAVSPAALREAEALAERLSDVLLDEKNSTSLVQNIQVFCSNLEELVRWLYTVAQKMEALPPPTSDLDGIKTSFLQYQVFQKEVSAHQPLTSSVLQTGGILLSCLDSTSPVLRDTLAVVERQTRALESHTDQLFSSVLSAMDRLTQPSGQPADRPADRPACNRRLGKTSS